MEESSSNSELSSDWDVLPGPGEKLEMEVPGEEDVKGTQDEEVLDTTLENSHHIELAEEEQVHQVVEELATEITEENNCHDSSSDVDVLEENVDDMNESFPSMDASFGFNSENSSESTSHSHQDNDSTAQQTWHQTAFTFIWAEMKEMFYRCFNDYIHPNREFVKVGVAISITLFALQMSYMAKKMEHTKKDKKNVDMHTQMMQRLKTLETENKELKSQVLSKIQNDKLFLLLEEQITHLKNENSKLSGTMEDLIDQLEEQTTIFKVENKNRERGTHEPYKKEIYKLKEQINILRIDNEDLQKQLVRMRYGSHPIQPTHKENSHKHKEGGIGQDQTHGPPSEIVTEEINDLQKKVFAELEKLKNWKDTVHKLITEHEKTQSDQIKLDGETHEKSKNKKHKNKKFYDWSWKDIKKNLKGSLEKFPTTLSEMFTKYVIIDQKKIENSFEIVNSYFQKAQDKTSKVFAEFAEENLFWDKLDTLKKKFHKVKDDFFNPDHNSKDEDFTDPVSFDSYLADPAKFKKYEMAQNSKFDVENKEDIKKPSFKTQEKFSEKSQQHQDYLLTETDDVDEKLAENEWHDVKNPTSKNVDSWLMDRAAQRSEMRSESNVETEEVNWFLRKNKDKELKDNFAK